MGIEKIFAKAPPGAKSNKAQVPIDDINPALPHELARAIRVFAACILVATLFAGQIMFVTGGSLVGISEYFLNQDVWWLAVLLVGLAAYLWQQPITICTAPARILIARPIVSMRVLAALVFVATLAGTFWVQLDYAYTTDELMAAFDAKIFGSGRLLEEVPVAWRAFVLPLSPLFTLPVAENAAWASTYLPGNAAFRALVNMVSVPQVANPLLAALAIPAAWSVARALWPDRLDAALVAVLLTGTSSQTLFMAMTPFAMTGHLLLTLVWLRLFCRNDSIGHVGCLTVGLVASGWHQLAFHALFVAPFVVHLWWSRRWSVATAYSLGYLIIALLWIDYGNLAAATAGVELRNAPTTGLSAYVGLVAKLTQNFGLPGLVMMLFNMLRFVAWENPILLPLAVAACWMGRDLPAALQCAAIGLCLTLVVVTVVIPFQGHGWGYRYLHGYIGVLALLAAAAWVKLVPAARALETSSWTPLVAASALVVFVQLPSQAFQVRAMIGPRVAASTAISKMSADVVVIDPRGLLYSENLVRNDPKIRTKPVMMDMAKLTTELVSQLCERGKRIAVYDHNAPAAAAIHGNDLLVKEGAFEAVERVAQQIKSLPCYVAIPPG
jgi:hypothetical protein